MQASIDIIVELGCCQHYIVALWAWIENFTWHNLEATKSCLHWPFSLMYQLLLDLSLFLDICACARFMLHEPGFVFTSSFLCRLLTLDKFRIHFNKITRSVFGRYNHEYARFGIQTAEYFWCHIMNEEALWWGYNLTLFRYAICYWCRRLPVLW